MRLRSAPASPSRISSRRNPNVRNEGIDLTEAMLAQAREKAEHSSANNWRLRVGDAYSTGPSARLKSSADSNE